MKDYIVFGVADNHYALDVAFVERIIHVLPVTPIPNSHSQVEGMISYEKKVTKVVNFRKMTGLAGCEEELLRLFGEAMAGYSAWIDTLKTVLEGGNALSLSPDPRVCKFETWLEDFSSHDPDILAMVKKLRPLQAGLLERGKEALWAKEGDPVMADTLLSECALTILPQIMVQMEGLIALVEKIAEHLQKMIIFRNGEQVFAIKVDSIDDMVQIDSAMLLRVDESNEWGPFLEMEGVANIGGNLINVIKTVMLPVREAA